MARAGRVHGLPGPATRSKGVGFGQPRKTGRFWHPRNFTRTWDRLRRRRFARGEIRLLEFHCTRHSFIMWALEAGTRTKKVAEWAGASVAVLANQYAHVVPTADERMDFLSSARRKSTTEHRPNKKKTRANARSAMWRRLLRKLERETGLEPATLSLGSRRGPQK